MAEPTAADDGRWRLGPALTVGALTLRAVERLTLQVTAARGHGWLVASLAPRALLVRDAGGVRVIGIGDDDGPPLSLTALRARVPGLAEWLDRP